MSVITTLKWKYFYNDQHYCVAGVVNMVDSKEKEPEKDSYKAVQAEFKNKNAFSRFFSKVQPMSAGTTLDSKYEIGSRKFRKGLVALVAVFGLAVGLDQVANQGKFLSSLTGGGEHRVEQVIPSYFGEIDYASKDYFSLKGDDLTYMVGPEIDGTSLVGKIVNMTGNPLMGSTDFIGVNELKLQGEDAVAYTKSLGITYTDPKLNIDKLTYQNLSNMAYNMKTGWEQEGLENIAVIGNLIDRDGQQLIQVIQDDNVVGQIRLAETNDYINFKLQELGDMPAKFYLQKGDTVDWSTDGKTDRRTTKDLFYATIQSFDMIDPTTE